MRAIHHYVDSSAVLAGLIEDRQVLQPIEGSSEVASSRLLWVEVSRALHRALQTQRLDPVVATEARHNFERLAAGIGRIGITETVLHRAEGPYPLTLRTLDALHLACAELWLAESNTADDPTSLAVWSLDERMNHCAAHLGFATPLLGC